MTTLTDATTAELADNDLVAVPKDELEVMQDRINALETDREEYQDHIGREFAEVRARITDVEDEVDAIQQTQPNSGGETPTQDDGTAGSADEQEQTPLETICSLPEQLVARELTANQERARFIARDVRDYGEKAPAGFVIDSRAIKRVITASEGTRPHTQTVARVMEFLEKLGKDAVEQKKRRGRKLVVFDEDLVARLANVNVANHSRCDRGRGETPGQGVMSG